MSCRSTESNRNRTM